MAETTNSIKGVQETKELFIKHMKEANPNVGFRIGLGICPETGKYTLEVRLSKTQAQFAKLFPSQVNGYRLNLLVEDTPEAYRGD